MLKTPSRGGYTVPSIHMETMKLVAANAHNFAVN
jgi:hypothetical protein